jgi:hypothetical protein
MGLQPHRADGAPVHYKRHRPEQTPLYSLAQQHVATFFAEFEAAAGADLPQFVKPSSTPSLRAASSMRKALSPRRVTGAE